MKTLVILASGKGSNAQRIIDHFASSTQISVRALISDRKASGALEVASSKGIETFYIPNEEIKGGVLSSTLVKLAPDLIVLAGFLRKIPEDLTAYFLDRIINVHPSLLPAHGGPGMYGLRVHEAVIEAGEVQSGITIHYVNEVYDEGRIIAQFFCPVLPDDSANSLAVRVQTLEHRYFPMLIHTLLSS